MALRIIEPRGGDEEHRTDYKTCIHEDDARMPKTDFVYPDELKEILESPEVREWLDEAVRVETVKHFACTLNRLLTEIIESKTPRNHAIVIAWSIGIKLDRLEDAWSVGTAVGMGRTALYDERKRILKLIRP